MKKSGHFKFVIINNQIIQIFNNDILHTEVNKNKLII